MTRRHRSKSRRNDERAKAVAAGLADVCALVEGGRVMCWGEDRTRKASRFGDTATPVALRLAR
jgi:hypothetical protein